VEGKPYDASDYTREERERIERLFTLVICACPKEGFTKTLAGCPDGCADEQKREVRAGVKAGKTDQQILEEQVIAHHTREVLSLPDSRLAHLVPYLALGVMVMVVLGILVKSIRPRPPAGSPAPSALPPGKAAAGGPAANGGRSGNADSAEEARLDAAVERDLAEMDE
jgi:cytochrome c-type biogenesis protein CcmH/NrfF